MLADLCYLIPMKDTRTKKNRLRGKRLEEDIKERLKRESRRMASMDRLAPVSWKPGRNELKTE
jgi:hypothetical protein